jgi:hypothetical protein
MGVWLYYVDGIRARYEDYTPEGGGETVPALQVARNQGDFDLQLGEHLPDRIEDDEGIVLHDYTPGEGGG